MTWILNIKNTDIKITRQKQKKYQIVDYAKGLIEKYNKVGIKDLDGNVYY